MSPEPVTVEVVRSGFVESVHHVRVVVVDADGTVAEAHGRVDEPVLLRSCAKPLQAFGMLGAGWRPERPEQVALACASHDGTDAHLDVVRSTLAAAGLDEEALGNTPGLALEPRVGAAQLLAGGPDRIHHNCSGKHAAMLATCAARGWPREGYLDPAHPLQVEILAAVEDLTGATAAAVAVDGCGAPIAALSLVGLAQAYRRLVTEPVAEAMRAHPVLVAGEERPATQLMRAIPGLIAKDGAEGVFVAAGADGRAVAVKAEDGALRAAVVAVADRLGVDALARPAVEGGGRTVGHLAPAR